MRLITILWISTAFAVDPDVALALDEARALFERGEFELASSAVRRLYAGDDRFAEAQREPLAEESAALLRDSARGLREGGELELAIQAYDAAWSVAGRPRDEEYAEVLFEYARRIDGPHPEQALYVARRAILVDPRFGAPRLMEERLSHNSMTQPARVAFVFSGLGLFTMAGSAWMAERMTHAVERGGTRGELDRRLAVRRTAIVGTWGGGALAVTGTVSGTLMFVGGRRRYEPVSPEILPALPDWPVEPWTPAP